MKRIKEWKSRSKNTSCLENSFPWNCRDGSRNTRTNCFDNFNGSRGNCSCDDCGNDFRINILKIRNDIFARLAGSSKRGRRFGNNVGDNLISFFGSILKDLRTVYFNILKEIIIDWNL
jgi:hypothetical protein